MNKIRIPSPLFVLLAAAAVAGTLLGAAALQPVAAADAVSVPARYKGDGGKVRLAENAFGTQVWTRRALQKYRLDKKYGFELEIVPTNTTQASRTAIQSGAADVGSFNFTDIARMRNAGINIIGIAPLLGWVDHVVVPTGSPVKTLADFKGKKFGTVSRTNLNWLVMRAAAQHEFKLDLERESTVHEGSIGLLRGLLEQTQLDGVIMFNNLTPAVVADGKFRVLAKIRDFIDKMGIPDAPFLLYAVDEGYAKAHPSNVRAYLAAYRESVDIMRAQDALWVEFGKEIKITDEKVLVPLRDEIRADIMTKFAPDTESSIRQTLDILIAIGGAEVVGMSTLPEGFMTFDFQ